MNLTRETWILFNYYIRLSLRSPIWVIVALFQPICYLFFYGPLLESFAKKAGMAEHQILTLFTPGLLVMVAFFGSMFVGFAMVDDLKSGFIERLRVTPVSRLALLLGRSIRDAITLVVQSLILIILSLGLGLHTDLVTTFLILAMMMLIGLFMAPISYALALTLKTEDAVGSIINFLAQPMLLLSGVFIPLTFAPPWLERLSAINPLKYIVEGCRAIFAGHFNDPVIPQSCLILFTLVALSLFWGVRAYNKAL